MKLSQAYQLFELAKIGETMSSTVHWYRRRIGTLISFLDDMPIKEITIHDLRRWRVWLWEKSTRWADHPGRPEEEGGLSLWTRHGHIRAIRHFFNFLVKEELLEHNPAQRLKLPPLPKEPPKNVSPADALMILAAAKDNPRDYAIVLFLADTGCRVAGLTSLRIEDLDLDGRTAPNGEVVYSASVREKRMGGPEARTVYLGDKTVEALRAYSKVRPQDESSHVFIGQRGVLQTSGVYQILKRLAKKAGIEGRWNPHAFRHEWARGTLLRGADIGTVSQVLGHSDINVTNDFYGRWTDLELGQRHKRFSWINSVDDA